MRRAETEIDRPGRRRALWYRDGLLIAMLCVWAPRARNVAATAIGISIQRRGAAWWTAFGSEETKNKRPIEIPLPSGFTPWIDQYLEHYRPLLARCSPAPVAGDAFWISQPASRSPAKRSASASAPSRSANWDGRSTFICSAK